MGKAEFSTSAAPSVELSFLAGGGEMGALIRSHDWAATPLGPPESWPQSLKTAVRIMLTSRQPIWIGWGEGLTYLYNDPYQSIIGGRHPWALGRPASEVWSEIWPEIGPMLDTAMGGVEGTYVEEQLLIMERNGYPEETYYTFSYSPIPDDDGTPGGIICANTDDTQRVIGERQLALLRELAARTVTARTSAQACEHSIAALATNPRDVTFALLYMAPREGGDLALASSVGATPGGQDAPQTLGARALHPWPVGEVMADLKTRVVGLGDRMSGPAQQGAWERPSTHAAVLAIPASGESGRAGALVVGLNPFRLFDAAYEGFLGLAAGQIAAAVASADAYEEERRRVEALAELDHAKTLFFSNVSHEFRTPLTLMLGPLEDVLAGEDAPDRTRQQVALAHRNGVRLLRLVNSLLDFSRIEAGRVRAAFEPVDLAAFSAEIASSFRSAIEKADLRLTLECWQLPAPVYVDREMWEKVLLNLISNAFKFTFDGEIGVSVAASPDGRAAVVKVRDTGIGVPPDEIPRLFERFHRVEGAVGRSFEGSGIGLALVQELVRVHGGEISVESKADHGTTFAISLPFGRRHLASDQVRDDPGAALPASALAQGYVDEALRWLPDVAPDALDGLDAPAPAADAPGTGKRVVLADDNADMRGYVARLLTGQGYAVTEASDGEAALAALRAATPDLVLTDAMMPKLDGFGLLRAIRGEPTLAGVPVIVLSARAGEEAKVEGLEAGADDYLIKPFSARELLARVHANIQMAEVRLEANRALFQSEQRRLITQDRLALALSTGRVSVFEWELASDRLTLHGPLAEAFGISQAAAAQGLPLATFAEGIHADDRQRVLAAVDRAMASGEAYEAEYRVDGAAGERVVIARGQVQTGADGSRRMSGVVIDVTDERAARTALEGQTRALQTLNAAAAAISGNLDLEHLVQTIVDAGVAVTGAQFGAFFYNVIDQAGERYTLYTLSGAPREAFERFPMPRNTPVFAPTFEGTAVVRSDNIRQDPRYGRLGPHHGQPEGHLPVVSYLAVPVKSRSGEVLGGLFFGHSDEGVFDVRSEDHVVGLAAQAAVAMDNAALFREAQTELAQRRRAEAELQALNSGLEERVTAEVAQRTRAEDALRQAQKMEAVGQLTGGVAHDFNNLLTVIIGGLDTIRRARPSDEARIARAVDMALQGAQRAANLTTRLLAFSRRQALQPRPLELNQMVAEMSDLLHRSLGEQVELESILAPGLWIIEADENQLESAILNLAVNARDAMPDGGKLTVETANATLGGPETGAAPDDAAAGDYVMISVGDTGTGMSKATLERVFEPFFTTKEVGRGTGLGLSMVYGFVNQSGGRVAIDSVEGRGTTVRLYFPRYRGDAAAPRAAADRAIPRAQPGETVLLVEDNAEVRAYSAMILSELGYGVLEAEDSEAALAILRADERIDLLFTDVVLPGRTGRALAEACAEIRPDLRVLFTTGYSRDAIVHHGRLDAGVQLITKPFTFDQLAVRVRDILDGPLDVGASARR